MTRQQPEAQLQRSVIAQLQWRARPGAWFCHIPNGGARSPIEGAIFKSLGVQAGCPDLLIVADGKALFLELKAPGRKLSPAQVECHDALRRAGATVETADNIDTALDQLTAWGLLRPNVSSQIATAFSELRDDVARRAARIRRKPAKGIEHEH